MTAVVADSKRLFSFACISVLLFFLCCQTSQGPIDSALTHRVTDYANLLTNDQVDSLTVAIEALESDIGSQIGILILSDLAGGRIEDVSLRYAQASQIGRAGYDDGVLITVAMEERQTRIEVGEGLEDIIKDDIAAKIIREKMVPLFGKGQFGSGLYAAVDEISKIIRANADKLNKRVP